MTDGWVTGQYTPFHYVHTLHNYGMAASKLNSGKFQVTMSHDKKRVLLEGEPLDVDKWKYCVHKIIEELERLTKSILMVDDLPGVDFCSIQDPPNHSMSGYYLGKDSKIMGVSPNPLQTPFHADSDELLFVSIALILTEILTDFDRS
jgi:hypothetical protein